MSRKGVKYALRMPRSANGIRSQWRLGAPSCCDMAAADAYLRALSAMDVGGRLAKGRKYTQSGQVLSMDGDGPTVVASVLGARREPYRVEIKFREPGAAAKARIAAKLRSDPAALAMLFAGSFPLAADQAFRAEGFDIFPGRKLGERLYDTTTSCSCPDWANPCKHVFAVLLLLAEEGARRPLSLLEHRGLTAADLVPAAASSGDGNGCDGDDGDCGEERGGHNAICGPGGLAKTAVEALGPLPFWRSTERCVPALAETVRRAAAKASKALGR